MYKKIIESYFIRISETVRNLYKSNNIVNCEIRALEQLNQNQRIKCRCTGLHYYFTPLSLLEIVKINYNYIFCQNQGFK